MFSSTKGSSSLLKQGYNNLSRGRRKIHFGCFAGKILYMFIGFPLCWIVYRESKRIHFSILCLTHLFVNSCYVCATRMIMRYVKTVRIDEVVCRGVYKCYKNTFKTN